jgi:glycosyltransferase involved in cell wall biosynthesis
MNQLLGSPEMLTEMGEAARNLYRHKFSWDAIAAQMLETLQKARND